jgi:hypothetical protein
MRILFYFFIVSCMLHLLMCDALHIIFPFSQPKTFSITNSNCRVIFLSLSNLSFIILHSSPDDAKALEIGMSGLSFVSRVPGSGSRAPALSGSSVSSAPDDHHHHHRHHSFGSISFPNSDSHQFQNNSLPPSPSSQVATGNWRYLPKPPGLSGASMTLSVCM